MRISDCSSDVCSSDLVQRTPQHPAMVQALPEQAQAVRSPAGPPRTVAAVSTQGAGQTLAERRNLAEIMSQVNVPEAERKPAVAPVDLAEVARIHAQKRTAAQERKRVG